jgi:tRNA-modifying protein YgfZ
MNTTWNTFLLAQQALAHKENHSYPSSTEFNSQQSIYPLTHLAVLTVTGNDAARLLQGQLTCNVNDINEAQSSLAAMCNPKGRVISTFLLVKNGDGFILILPEELSETIKKRLQMYVLRSDVKITDSSDTHCLLGLCEPELSPKPFSTILEQNIIKISFPGLTKRQLLITGPDNAISLWSEYTLSKKYHQASQDEWRYLDILAEIPWLTTETSEEFIPQMINLDKLGGISFNKGCYTGQEIVARTHYLGKSKRGMVLAECPLSTLPEPNAAIIDLDSNEQVVVGHVLTARQDQHNHKMLVIIQIAEPAFTNLGLQNHAHAKVNLLPFSA